MAASKARKLNWQFFRILEVPMHVFCCDRCDYPLPGGMDQISWGSLLSDTYDLLWKSIIRPPRLRDRRNWINVA